MNKNDKYEGLELSYIYIKEKNSFRFYWYGYL